VTHGRQLAFAFPHCDRYDPAAFIPGDANADALAWLDSPAHWPGLRLAIHGDRGTGKTHLLHLFAARHGAALLPARLVRGPFTLPPPGAIAIDDADTVPDKEALLHLLNAAAERRQPVLLAAGLPPARWPAVLPDLDSRLRATTAVGIGQPDDGLLQALLARLIGERQLVVDEYVQAYLLARLPRSCAALREAAARLDRVSLAEGKRVSRAIASAILREMENEMATELLPDEYSVPPAVQPSPGDARLL
jgi:chromosomal replication initiation ATPase DnaA